jgi:hypothetical protein
MNIDFLLEKKEELNELAYETFLEHYGFKPKHANLKMLIPEILDPYNEDFNLFGVIIVDPTIFPDAIYFPCIFSVHVGQRGGRPVDEEEDIFTVMGYSNEIGLFMCTTNLIINNQ